MIDLIGNCTQTALMTTSFVQNKLTVPFLESNLFLKGVQIIQTDSCDVFLAPTASGIELKESDSPICEKVNPVTNTYEGRGGVLQNIYESKKVCKNEIMCSAFNAQQYATVIRDELWQAWIRKLQFKFLEALFSDTGTFVRKAGVGPTGVKAIDDNATGASVMQIDKAGLTADTVHQFLAKIVSKFRAAKIGAQGITIFMPYEMELLISGGMANKQCCQWYSDIMFDDNASKYTINGMQVNIVTMDKDMFPAGATGYTRIVAVANNRIALVYNPMKIYGGYTMNVPQYIDQFAAQQFYNNINTNTATIMDFYMGDPSREDIGTALLMKVLAHFRFIRMQEKCILFIDAKDDIFA